MGKIKVKAPCKINLTLKVDKARPDGFHPIESVMAALNLFDVIEIETFFDTSKNEDFKIKISSNSNEIPHDKTNIAYKAAHAFFKAAEIKSGANIYIEKNIPVCAGLAGGSTDAAAVIWGLNRIFDCPLDENKTDTVLSSLGSDLNFCYKGGMKMCKGRGEILEDIEFQEIPVTLIKPKDLKISAKEAYIKHDEALDKGLVSNLPNDLEFALSPHYKELQYLHTFGFQMSGSGPTFFAKQAFLPPEIKEKLQSDYLIIENLKTFRDGVFEV